MIKIKKKFIFGKVLLAINFWLIAISYTNAQNQTDHPILQNTFTMSSENSPKTLIDKYLSDYTYDETHSIIVKSPSSVCYQKMANLDLSQLKLVKKLFKLRGMPVEAQKLSDFARKMNFTLLEENQFSEFIFGFGVTKDGIQKITDSAQFTKDDAEWFRKVVWNFEFIPVEDNQTKVVTSTRIKNITFKDKVQFSVYWIFVRPFSGLIRKQALKKLKEDIEQEKA